MKRLLFSSVVIVLAVSAFAISVSWSDNTPIKAAESEAPAEAITGEAMTPNPGSETVRHDPFTPYDIGGDAAAWTYKELSAEEQAQADRGRDVRAWDKISRDWAVATKTRSQAARASTAADRLNAGRLGTLGVVP